MSRPLRIEYPGAFYHVTSRGNARAAIFLDDDDRTAFLNVLSEVIRHSGWLCHAYCLMDNHYHLLIETPNGNLARGMRQLNGIYTQRFNRRHNRVGHIFQGRYKAIIVERDNYLLELSRYIVLNPFRAGTAKEISSYRWSSYRAMSGLDAAPDWLNIAWILGQFGQDVDSQQRFAEFVEEGKHRSSPWLELKGQILLGTDNFVSQLKPRLKMMIPEREIPREQLLPQRPDMELLFSKTVLADKQSRNDSIRHAYLEYGCTMKDIARQTGLHHSTVSKIIKGER